MSFNFCSAVERSACLYLTVAKAVLTSRIALSRLTFETLDSVSACSRSSTEEAVPILRNLSSLLTAFFSKIAALATMGKLVTTNLSSGKTESPSLAISNSNDFFASLTTSFKSVSSIKSNGSPG